MASGTSPPSGLLSLVSVSPTSYGSTIRQNEPSGIGLIGLRKLCALLRNEGDRVLSGQSVFTLTSEVLSHLLVSCRRHSIVLSEQASAAPDPPIRSPTFVINRRVETGQIPHSLQDEWNAHIQFIKDFMLSTPNLKVVHNQGTLSFPISLHRFCNINKLQLRRIPIHMVEGLQMHRQSLESLVIYRGVNALKDLLECCGGDRSAPLTWPRLKALSLMFNTIPDLDDSLRLLPHVETLDLSHNCLEKCDVYLEYLGDLVFISLAYNLLTSVPSFSLSSRTSLVSLVLRGNNLDQIKGIENLTVLEELDLGENCISDHSFLEPLAYLTRLGQLQLDANPLFYHRRHRRLTASCLSRQSLSLEFELDKRKLTLSEITYYSPRNGQRNYKKIPGETAENPSPQRSSTPERRPSLSSGIGTELESSDIVVRSPRRSKRKRLKPRETEILETSGDFTSSRDASPGTTPRRNETMRMRTEEALRTKEQVEELRRHFGPNWLQAIEDRNIFNKDRSDASARYLSDDVSKSDNDANITTGKLKNSKTKKKEKFTQHKKASPLASEPTSKTDTGDEWGVKSGDDQVPVNNLPVEADVPDSKSAGSTTCPSDSDVFTSSEKTEVANPIMAALARLAAQQAEGDVNTAPKIEGGTANDADQTAEILTEDNSASEYSNTPAKHFISSDETAVNSSTTVSKLSKQIEALSPIKSADEAQTSILESSENGSSTADVERSTSLDSSADIQLDEMELTEPMVATLPQQDNKMILLSWSLSYLLEKDIKDKLTEKLELGSLQSMESRTVSDGGEGLGYDSVCRNADEKIELTLRFDYINKDRQKRSYLLDAADCKAVIDHLQPFLDARVEEAKAKLAAVMQCLRCNRTFLKSEVLKKEKKLPSSGNLQDLKALQELMDKTAFMCPKCGSSIVIDFIPSASEPTATTASTSSTPLGSYNSSEGWMEKGKQKAVAKLTRMKSSDKFDLVPGSRVSQLVRKESSSSLLDFSRSRQSSVKSNGSVTKDSRTNSIENSRDRSNAFSVNKMSRSVAVLKRERSVSEQGELIPIEDYFEDESVNTDVSSSRLAAMTTSLRGDYSTAGSKASVRRSSLKQTTDGDTGPEIQARPIDKAGRGSSDMADSGFLSGVNSHSLDQTKIVSTFSSGLTSQDDPGRSELSKGLDSQREVDGGRKRKMSTISQHKHLSAMEELVNSMVQEGHSIDNQISTSQGSLGHRSMSVSAFRDLVSSSPSNNRRGSKSSPTEAAMIAAIFQRSDSASSIAVLSSGNSVGDDACSGILSFTLGNGSKIVNEANEGKVVTQSREGENEAVPRVVSPLSSDICSSMVSSVYESSVKTLNTDGINGQRMDGVNHGSTENVSTPIPVAVGDGNDSSSSSEDMTSIYDLPRKPKKSHSKKRSKVRQSKEFSEFSQAAAEFSNNQGGGNRNSPFHKDVTEDRDNVDTTDGRNLDRRIETLPSKQARSVELSGYSNTDNINGENDSRSDSETEVLNEMDVTPKYAFHHLNHRLTLYLMMTLFEPHEEFVCKIQGEFSQYIIDESYEGIFVMSSARFYILKIMSEDHMQDPSQWVNCIEIQPIPELRYIDLGLGAQSLRLEFVTDCSSYTIITRNRDRTTQFIDVLHTNLAKYAVSHGIASHVVVNEDVDQTTLDNLDKDVLSKVNPDQKLLLYCMGFIQRGITNQFPVSFVIGTNDICLVRTSHQWPQPRLQAPITVETVGRQFVVLERQLVNNVASVNVDESSLRKISLELFNEKEGVSTHWNITLASRQTSLDFVDALSIPWKREFGVEMDVGYSELNF